MTEANPLILLFGMPRSGTTWLGKLFDSHPDTLYRHEPDSVDYLKTRALLNVDDSQQYAESFQAFARRLGGTLSVRVNSKLPLFPKSYYSWPAYHAHRLLVMGEKGLSQVIPNPPCPDLINKKRNPQLRIVWKSIDSLGRYGALVRAIDPVRGVHIVRHPCGYVSSILRGERQGKFLNQVEASEEYGFYQKLAETPQARELGVDFEALKLMEPIERLAWRWVIFNAKAMDDVQGLDDCTVFTYESLCADPLGMTRQLFDFCGLDWNPQTENFIDKSTSTQGDAYYSVFKHPQASANRWQKELDAGDIERILAVVRNTPPGRLFDSIAVD